MPMPESSDDSPDDASADASSLFDRLVGQLDSPMFVVTCASADARAGCLVGFASQVSIDPSRFLVCLSKANRTTRVASTATTLVVHLPRRDDEATVRLFGEETGDDVDKFARCDWRPGPGGVPVLDGLDWFAGTIADRFDVGDHVAHLLDVITGAGSAEHLGEPSYDLRAAQKLDPGHDA
jgi:flavin reductase (DIM6/NTAB) family NADH-FMN oxidoreductase RutF